MGKQKEMISNMDVRLLVNGLIQNGINKEDIKDYLKELKKIFIGAEMGNEEYTYNNIYSLTAKGTVPSIGKN